MDLNFAPVSPNSNKGSETHRLMFCDFAGWDPEEQFFLNSYKTAAKEEQLGSDAGAASAAERGSQADVTNSKETKPSVGARREEREADLPPGTRLAVVVGCQAK